jgi:hypothetical protein
LKIDDQPGLGVRDGVQTFEKSLHICREIQRVGDDDDVEFLVQRQQLA